LQNGQVHTVPLLTSSSLAAYGLTPSARLCRKLTMASGSSARL
jgi:hypothetical protein